MSPWRGEKVDESWDTVPDRISFSLKYWHLVEFNLSHAFTSPWQHGSVLVLSLLAGNTLVSFGRYTAAVILGVLFYVGCWAFQFAAVLALLFLPKYRALLGEHVVVLSADGIAELSARANVFHHWCDITRVRLQSDAVAIYYLPREAILVPRSAFASHAQMKAFFDHVSELRRARTQ